MNSTWLISTIKEMQDMARRSGNAAVISKVNAALEILQRETSEETSSPVGIQPTHPTPMVDFSRDRAFRVEKRC